MNSFCCFELELEAPSHLEFALETEFVLSNLETEFVLVFVLDLEPLALVKVKSVQEKTKPVVCGSLR